VVAAGSTSRLGRVHGDSCRGDCKKKVEQNEDGDRCGDLGSSVTAKPGASAAPAAAAAAAAGLEAAAGGDAGVVAGESVQAGDANAAYERKQLTPIHQAAPFHLICCCWQGAPFYAYWRMKGNLLVYGIMMPFQVGQGDC
jgi:hypothetical protein